MHCSLIWMRTGMQHSPSMRPCLQKMLPAMNWDMQFTVTTSEGYGGDIQFAMGIQDDGTLNGISILSIGETAGLGMRANTDAFKDQFKDKKVDKFEYTKQVPQQIIRSML